VRFPDLDDDQICDVSDLGDVRGYLIGLATHWKQAFEKTGFKPMWPTAEQCAQIAQQLRPTFETKVSASAEIKNLESDIVKLTERQITVFEGLMENDRVLVKGGAGTGKTLLALRSAEGKAEQGLKVGLFCSSPQLAEFFEWAAEEIDNYIDGLEAEAAGKKAPENKGKTKKKEDLRIYTDCFPTYMNKEIIPHFGDAEPKQFDVLVLDEAQELITPAYTDALDRILKGGLKDGIWCMFVDSEPDLLVRLHQSIGSIDAQLKEYNTYFTRFTLKENCRNSQAIADTVDELFGMTDQPMVREEYGQEVKFVPYASKEEQTAHLMKQLKALLDDGVKPEEIVILSPKKREDSASASLENVYDSWQEARKKEGVLFSTIEDFKSMESPVVIIADCEKASLSTEAQSMYIAMTRARGMLIVNLDTEAKAYLDKNRGKGFLQRYV